MTSRGVPKLKWISVIAGPERGEAISHLVTEIASSGCALLAMTEESINAV